MICHTHTHTHTNTNTNTNTHTNKHTYMPLVQPRGLYQESEDWVTFTLFPNLHFDHTAQPGHWAIIKDFVLFKKKKLAPSTARRLLSKVTRLVFLFFLFRNFFMNKTNWHLARPGGFGQRIPCRECAKPGHALRCRRPSRLWCCPLHQRPKS